MRLIIAFAFGWLLQSLVLIGAANAEKRIALLIGNKEYTDAVGPLKNPHNDIALVGGALRKVGFEVIQLQDANRLQILSAVRDFAEGLRTAGAEAVGFFYYSGHGAAETETGPNYLIPTSVMDTNDPSIWDASVPLRKVINLLKRSAPQAAHFIVFDACRNELKTSHKSISKGFIAERDEQGVYIAFATAENRKASDVGQDSGPYAKALASEITKSGQHHMDMFFNVRQTVFRAIGQTPWDRNGLFRRIYFSNQKLAGPSNEFRDAPSAIQTDFDERALELTFWKEIQSSSDPIDYLDYLRRFPAGVFSGRAKRKLARLEQSKPLATSINKPKQPVVLTPIPILTPAEPRERVSTASTSELDASPTIREAQLTHELQGELKRVGCLDGEVDGKWGPVSQRALWRFSTVTGQGLASAKPTTDTLRIVQAVQKRVCPMVCPKGQAVKADRCVKIAGPAVSSKFSLPSLMMR